MSWLHGLEAKHEQQIYDHIQKYMIKKSNWKPKMKIC